MDKIKQYLPWTVRIIIFILFVVSAVAKMFPIWAFEKQLIDLGITSWCYAPYLARFIIGLELAIGFAILQPHFLKRIVIPGTILLLVVFNIHLSIEMYKHGAMNGNCGCFGQLIPMTPLEAFIKNLIAIGLLIYLYRTVKEKERGENKFSYLLLIYLASALALFAFFPFCPCTDAAPAVVPEITEDSAVLEEVMPIPETDTVAKTLIVGDTIKKVVENPGPKKVRSKFAEYTLFGTKKANLDKDKKIVCLFVPGCDHCRDAAKELVKIGKSGALPPAYVLFMNEEAEKIPDFYKETGINYPYHIIEIPKFWKLMGDNTNTPGIAYLWNGNILKFYEGSEANKLNAEELKKACESSSF